MRIVVAGAGAFGTALATALVGKDHITLLGRDPAAVDGMRKTRRNPTRLPGAELPSELVVTAGARCLADAEIVLICVPAQQLATWLEDHAPKLDDKALIACCKGIDLTTLEGAADIIARQVPGAVPAVLTGPSFAAEIAKGLPTALTLACADAQWAKRLQTALTRPILRLYRTTDVTGAQLGGALKNVIAIAAGACVGAGLGESARAALITRGFAEMQRLAQALGARPDTLMGLSGLGDLILTCSSEQSRNFRFGLAIGRGEGFDPGVTVEGSATALAAGRIARDHGLDLPVTSAVGALVAGQQNVNEALQTLLSRPLKQE
jgi:glycerol-3-phosphate dehydrogenase (NAD(P)+)